MTSPSEVVFAQEHLWMSALDAVADPEALLIHMLTQVEQGLLSRVRERFPDHQYDTDNATLRLTLEYVIPE